ncbi:hypothetical protein CLV48_11860 [Cecembia rubra]|uniref:Uncharacterized protein n=1 Tax=Cecembia rubra TaxID=1485585 RepID=A0A2P8DNL5_9BACT|nr:hypothetical protein CLV48_11860 [Cecembia rubra]
MEQFREGRKPVNKMKPYIFIIGIVTLTCLGCTTREEREIKALMTAVFQKELALVAKSFCLRMQKLTGKFLGLILVRPKES